MPVDLWGCNDATTMYTRVKELKAVETIVIAKSYTTSAGNFTIFYLDQPDVSGLNVPWVACNLPDAYKKDRLAVRINGYTLTYPGMESDNSIGSPIELTRIEVR
ncbi:hypothetical protein GCM10028773_39560 [Spirosoma koreense]